MKRGGVMPKRVAIGLLVSFTFGCSSSYVPLQSPRVAIVMEGGSHAFVRDGVKYEGGLFGGDIEAAVRGNPKAEAQARTYKNLVVGGFVLTLAGEAAAVGGLSIIGADAARNQTLSTPAAVLLGGGVVGYLVGLGLLLSAPPHLYDAVNIYNDGLTPP
jgi:hypothetical protein